MDFCPSLNKHRLNLLLNQTFFLNIAPVLITSPSSLHSSLTQYFLSYQTNYLSSFSRSFSTTYPPFINPHSLNILTLKMSPLVSNHLVMPASLIYLINFLESIWVLLQHLVFNKDRLKVLLFSNLISKYIFAVIHIPPPYTAQETNKQTKTKTNLTIVRPLGPLNTPLKKTV